MSKSFQARSEVRPPMENCPVRSWMVFYYSVNIRVMPLTLNRAVRTWYIFRIFIKLKFDWISLLNEVFIDIFLTINIIDHSSLLFLQPNGPQPERGSQEQKMFSTFFWGFHPNCTAMLRFGFQEKYLEIETVGESINQCWAGQELLLISIIQR